MSFLTLCSMPYALCHNLLSALWHIKRNTPFYLAAILIALALKQHYSQARPENLEWILNPTAGLVSLASGRRFTFEAGKGYVCDAAGVIIAPGCAGVNFMLMAFGMAVFAGLHYMRNGRHRFAWLVASLTASYGWTLGVNTLRILVSIQTFHMGIFGSGLKWEWVHRMEGVVIYFFFQYLFYSMIRKIIDRYSLAEPARRSGRRLGLSGRRIVFINAVLTGLTPCVWYLAITLAVPFLNGAPRKTGGRFYDHAVIVLSLCLTTWMCIAFAKLCAQIMRLLFTGGDRKHEAQNPDR